MKQDRRALERVLQTRRPLAFAAVLVGALGCYACRSSGAADADRAATNPPEGHVMQHAAVASGGPPSSAVSAAVPASTATPAAATVGHAAPLFALRGLDGKEVKLADYRGKVVVLEWMNPECPFVRLSHTKGSLVGTAERQTKRGVVWLAINSSAPGKQGSGVDKSAEAKRNWHLDHPILLDESGDVGRSYGATNTPNMFVIDKAGNLAYRGAIDNSPDAEGASPQGGALVNYVEAAISAIEAGRPVAVAETAPYGCSVKYASR